MSAALLRARRTSEFTVVVPGSKSLANRALICASLASGRSIISGLPDGDDVRLMRKNLTTLGVEISGDDALAKIEPGEVLHEVTVHCGLAGTTSRFLAAFAATRKSSTVIDGSQRLRERPMSDLMEALRQIGSRIDYLEAEGSLPVRVHAHSPSNREISLRGDISSQFISALMLIGPRLGGLTVHISTSLVSSSYIEMTAGVMRHFGAEVVIDDATIHVGGTPYVGTQYMVEPDFSSAAFPIVAALVGGSTVTVPRLALSATQGDAYVLDIALQAGAKIEQIGDDIRVRRDPTTSLRPFSVDLSDCSDLAPVVAVLALFAEGTSELSGIGFIREKESNRVDGLAIELRKCGASVEIFDDGLRIEGGTPLKGATLCVNGDHRLAMSFAVLALGVDGISIDDPAAVDKSWPSFWDDMSDVVSRA